MLDMGDMSDQIAPRGWRGGQTTMTTTPGGGGIAASWCRPRETKPNEAAPDETGEEMRTLCHSMEPAS
jgi:hypothetical protein